MAPKRQNRNKAQRRERSVDNNDGPTAPENEAAADYQFDLRRACVAAYNKFEEKMEGASKDDIVNAVFKAADAVATFDPEESSADGAMAQLSTDVTAAVKSKEAAEFLVEKCRGLITPKPRAKKPPPPPPREAPPPAKQEQQQQQQRNRFENDMNRFNMPPPQYQQQQQQQQQQQVSGGGGGFCGFRAPAAAGASSSPLLPDPVDPRVCLLVNISGDILNEATMKRILTQRFNSISPARAVFIDSEHNRAVIFCYDPSQAIMLKSVPPGGIFASCLDSRFTECDKPTWQAACAGLRQRVHDREAALKAELEEIDKQEAAAATAGAGAGADGESAAAAAAAEKPKPTSQSEKLRGEIADVREEVAKFEKEAALLEELGEAIPGGAQRREVVTGELKRRAEAVAEMEKALEAAVAVESEQQQQQRNSDQQQQDGTAEPPQQEQQGPKPATFSSSSQNVTNPRGLLFFCGFPAPMSDQKVLALLRALEADPLHIWRNSASNDLCVELVRAGAGADQVLQFLSFNDFSFAGVIVSKRRPGY